MGTNIYAKQAKRAEEELERFWKKTKEINKYIYEKREKSRGKK